MGALRLCDAMEKDGFKCYTFSPVRGSGEGKNVLPYVPVRC